MLLAAGLLVGVAFLAEPVLLLRRRRQAAARAAGPGWPAPVRSQAVRARGRAPRGLRRVKARVVLADYDRVVVTHSAS